MKKLLILAFVMTSMVFAVPSAQALTTSENVETIGISNAAQDKQKRPKQNRRVERNNDWRNNNGRGVRFTYQTRLVRRGRHLYRETYRVKYLPNGKVQTKLVSSVRIR